MWLFLRSWRSVRYSWGCCSAVAGSDAWLASQAEEERCSTQIGGSFELGACRWSLEHRSCCWHSWLHHRLFGWAFSLQSTWWVGPSFGGPGRMKLWRFYTTIIELRVVQFRHRCWKKELLCCLAGCTADTGWVSFGLAHRWRSQSLTWSPCLNCNCSRCQVVALLFEHLLLH